MNLHDANARRPTTLDELLQTLPKVGKTVEVYQCPDGTRALVLPYGGRILGLFAPGSLENFFWTHPALTSTASAKELYEQDEWPNSGGDRTWLSPEVDCFLPKYPRTDKYVQPPALDPGKYELTNIKGKPVLVNRLSLTLSRSKRKVDLEITKSLAPAPNPLRYERGLEGQRKVEYAGYTLHTSLSLLGAEGTDSPRVGLWNLLQLPHGGELLVPTYRRVDPTMIFGDIPPEDLSVKEHLVRFNMRGPGAQKFSLRAVDTTGRLGYLYPCGNQLALVIRNVFVNPSGEYVDVPWDDAEDLGYCVQACNIDNELGSFSELECHTPAIGQGTSRTRCEEESQVWAFRGAREQIENTARRLLTGGM